MALLDMISKPADRPVIVTITGDSGMGKTTLAASFPKPVFIRVEDGLQAIPVSHRPDALPLVGRVEQLWEQMQALIVEKHDYKTVVIDSITALERLLMQYIIESDPKQPKSINQAMGGYGAGLAAVGALHQQVRRAAGKLVERGCHVVFIAHADTETVELPDSDPFTRYCLRLGKKSLAPYVDDVDLVGFLKLRTFYTGDGDRKKAISDGNRVLVCYATGANVSKNRYGITEDLQVQRGANPLAAFIPSLKIEG